MTLTELRDRLVETESYPDFLPKYVSLLTPAAPNRTEEEFVKAMAEHADHGSHRIESVAKEVSGLITTTFYCFKAIAETATLEDVSNVLQIQNALHERMFATLAHIGRNCRELLELQVDSSEHGELDCYVQSLISKHHLAAVDKAMVSQTWQPEDERIYTGLCEQEYYLRTFPDRTQDICFQIYGHDQQHILTAKGPVSTSNGLVRSRPYFVLKILMVLQHLQAATQLLEIDRVGPVTDGVEMVELSFGTMDPFIQSATELISALNQP